MKRGAAHKDFVKIQEIDGAVEDFGPANEWENVMTAQRCTITPQRGTEIIEGQQVASRVTHKVEMRWQPGIKSHMRLVVDDQLVAEADKRVLHIDAVIDLKNRRRDLLLLCVEQP